MWVRCSPFVFMYAFAFLPFFYFFISFHVCTWYSHRSCLRVVSNFGWFLFFFCQSIFTSVSIIDLHTTNNERVHTNTHAYIEYPYRTKANFFCFAFVLGNFVNLSTNLRAYIPFTVRSDAIKSIFSLSRSLPIFTNHLAFVVIDSVEFRCLSWTILDFSPFLYL